MKEIPLRGQFAKGKVAIVDDEDYEYLSRYKWHVTPNGYARKSIWDPSAKIEGSIAMHREILVPPDTYQIDHINGNKLDNRRDNLRICTPSQNKMNVGKTSKNKSGYRGVSKERRLHKWRVSIKADGRRINLGNFYDILDAARAYNEAAKKYFGEFARLNVIPD